MKKLILSLLAAALLSGCTGAASGPSQWESESMWYDTDDEVDTTLADVFYILSTNVLTAVDSSSGEKSYQAQLTEADRQMMSAELGYADDMFGDSLNFFGPYYHQFTMESADLPEEEFDEVFDDVSDEVFEAFSWYMENVNDGRPYVLAGFSQGAMLVLELLKRMSDEQYSRMAAAYMLGYRLSDEDLEHPHVRAATDDDDWGVTVSFNSVMSPENAWPLLSEDAATCINPLNWTTDGTPATLDFNGDIAEVSVDTCSNLLIVKGLDKEDYIFEPLAEFCEPGNLHHWDLLFYKRSIQKNALLRVYGDDDGE